MVGLIHPEIRMKPDSSLSAMFTIMPRSSKVDIKIDDIWCEGQGIKDATSILFPLHHGSSCSNPGGTDPTQRFVRTPVRERTAVLSNSSSYLVFLLSTAGYSSFGIPVSFCSNPCGRDLACQRNCQ